MPFSYLDKDPQVAAAVSAELSRQRDSIELIASENFTSPAVMEAAAASLPINTPKATLGSAITAAAKRLTW